MAKRKSLDELEILSPKELGEILINEICTDNPDINYIKMLIECGASLGMIGGTTALCEVSSKGDYFVDLAKLLISAGANVNAREDRWGDTPLHHAANKGSFEMSRLLIISGADLDAINKDGESPTMVAPPYFFDDDGEGLNPYYNDLDLNRI